MMRPYRVRITCLLDVEVDLDIFLVVSLAADLFVRVMESEARFFFR